MSRASVLEHGLCLQTNLNPWVCHSPAVGCGINGQPCLSPSAQIPATSNIYPNSNRLKRLQMMSSYIKESTEAKQPSRVKWMQRLSNVSRHQAPGINFSVTRRCPRAQADSRRAAAAPGSTSGLRDFQKNGRNHLSLWFSLGSKSKLAKAHQLVVSHLSLADIGYTAFLEPSIGKRSRIILILIWSY